MSATYMNLMKAQERRHDHPLPSIRNYGSADELRAAHSAAKARLWGRPGARPGANMPRTGTTIFRNMERPALDVNYALRLVCEDQQVTPEQIMSSRYSAATAARHMLWTVLFDGGHPISYIAAWFGADGSSVRLGIQAFRKFQRESLG